MNNTANLTDRQKEILQYVGMAKVVGSGHDGSILRALARKGLVIQHFNSAPGYVYYTWTLSAAGLELTKKENN